MPGNERISALMEEFAGQVGHEFAGALKAGINPEACGYATFGLGVQFALELAQLSPDLARQLIEQIHLEHQDSKGDWNKSAKMFIERMYGE